MQDRHWYYFRGVGWNGRKVGNVWAMCTTHTYCMSNTFYCCGI